MALPIKEENLTLVTSAIEVRVLTDAGNGRRNSRRMPIADLATQIGSSLSLGNTKFKGVIDCSANPNYPAADAGDEYRISVAGKIGGASGLVVSQNDIIICKTDGTVSGTQAAVGAQWTHIVDSGDGVVIGPASSTNNDIARFDGTTGKLLKAGLSVDTDITFAANSDSRVPTQKAVKAATDGVSFFRAVKDSHRRVERVAYRREGAQTFYPDGVVRALEPGLFGFWAFAFDPSRSMVVPAVMVPVIAISGLVSIQYKLWRRPHSSPSTSGPGLGGGDELLLTDNATLVEAGINAQDTFVQMARLDMGNIEVSKDWTYLIGYAGLDVSENVVLIGASTAYAQEAVRSVYYGGWYGYLGFNGTYAQLNQFTPLAFIVIELTYEELPVPGADSDYATTDENDTLVGTSHGHSRTVENGVSLITTGLFQVRSDHSVTIPQTNVRRAAGDFTIESQDIVLTALASNPVVDELHTMVSGEFFQLNFRYVSSVVVRKQSDSALLTLNTDYSLAPETGGVTPHVSVAVKISYTSSYMRYDTIYYDPETREVGVATGTYRAIDPEEYMPTIPSGMQALYNVFVYLRPTYFVAELIPTYQYRNYVRIGREAEHQQNLAWNRSCLPKTFRKLHLGSAIKLACYGDSQTLAGVPTVTDSRQTAGDVSGFYVQRVGTSDTIALYSSLAFTEDGNSKLPLNWPWFIKKAMESRWGSTVTYGNFGIGGTGSDSGAHGGSNATRMSALVSYAPDLCIIAFGMNSATYAEMATIIQTFKAAGIECFILGVAARNFYAGTAVTNYPSRQQWVWVNEMLVRVARDNHCAYVNTVPLFDLGCEGATGLSQRTAATLNTNNHSGIRERRILGEVASFTFGGKIGAIPTGP